MEKSTKRKTNSSFFSEILDSINELKNRIQTLQINDTTQDTDLKWIKSAIESHQLNHKNINLCYITAALSLLVSLVILILSFRK